MNAAPPPAAGGALAADGDAAARGLPGGRARPEAGEAEQPGAARGAARRRLADEAPPVFGACPVRASGAWCCGVGCC
jgi:hypothetical protein